MLLIFCGMYTIQIPYLFLFSYSIHVKLQAKYNHFGIVSYSIQAVKAKIPLESTYSWWLQIQIDKQKIKLVRENKWDFINKFQ